MKNNICFGYKVYVIVIVCFGKRTHIAIDVAFYADRFFLTQRWTWPTLNLALFNLSVHFPYPLLLTTAYKLI